MSERAKAELARAEKIAVFRGLYLGDLVAATGALRALRRASRAEITLVSLPWASALLPHLAPHVDRFLPYPGAPGLDGWEGETNGEEELGTFVERARSERFDLAINMHGRGPVSTRLVARFGAKRIASFVGGEGEYPTLDVSVPWDAETHESRKLLLLAERAGGITGGASEGAWGGAAPELRAGDPRRARALLPAASLRKPLALVHPGASVPDKRWPEEGFGRVVRSLIRQGYAVAVTGGSGERELTRRVREAAPDALDLGGRTDLSALVALVSVSDVLISNDTGPAHLAYALKTPSVTLFGPSTDVGRWGPLDGIRHAVLRGDQISDIAVGEVLRTVGALAVGGERSA